MAKEVKFGRSAREKMLRGIDILADILNDSTFDPDELRREQHVILQEIGAAHDTPDDIVFDRFTETAFRDQTIGRSIEKTGRVIIAEQTARRLSMGATWCAEIQERFFDYLDYEILRVTGGLAAPTVSSVLNRAALGNVEDLKGALLQIGG